MATHGPLDALANSLLQLTSAAHTRIRRPFRVPVLGVRSGVLFRRFRLSFLLILLCPKLPIRIRTRRAARVVPFLGDYRGCFLLGGSGGWGVPAWGTTHPLLAEGGVCVVRFLSSCRLGFLRRHHFRFYFFLRSLFSFFLIDSASHRLLRLDASDFFASARFCWLNSGP